MNKQQLLEALRIRGFSKEIINAFLKVKREDFIPSELRSSAYEDIALPIGKGQTISQPYTIAIMLSLLDLKSVEKQRILEVGSGCGYVLALISEIVGKKGRIYGIEIVRELWEKSIKNLRGYKNIKVYYGSGEEYLREKYATSIKVQKGSPPSVLRGENVRETSGSFAFDRIIISAGCEKIPDALKEQLKENGIIVAPVGDRHEQSLMVFKKTNGKLKLIKKISGFVFVPFV